MFILDGKVLPVDVPFEHNGVQYPSNWLRLSTPEEKEGLGITEVVEQPRPDDRYYWISDNGDGTFSVVPKDLDDIKALRITEIKKTAGGLLAPTDWKIIRSVETGSSLAPDFLSERQAIRAKSNVYEAQINACTSVEQVAALSFDWVIAAQ